MDQLMHGDCVEELKRFPDGCVDLVCTDPPYGYSFMGRDWDRAVPSANTWRACLRLLKPGGFAFVICAPRQDVLAQMLGRLAEAGFVTNFSSLYWSYATGFPKAANMARAVAKRAAALGGDASQASVDLNGAYGGFQPKPAVEVIIIAMKPLSESNYLGQAVKNGKGVTWLDDCRIPAAPSHAQDGFSAARFPANLLISDDVLDDGRIRRGSSTSKVGTVYGEDHGTGYLQRKPHGININDAGGYSRYFSLDAWARKLPFLVVAKAGRKEKDDGLEQFTAQCRAGLPLRAKNGVKAGRGGDGTRTDRVVMARNPHPTVKPLQLMSYLITLGSRPGDVVLDPFLGSGTTAVAAALLRRSYIGIERERQYFMVARARIRAATRALINHS